MTTAKVKYRDHVPYGWIAVEFCDIYFYGENADEFKDRWYAIKYEKYHKQKFKIDNLCVSKEECETKKTDMVKDLKQSKDWRRFWDNKYERSLKYKIKELNQKIAKINSEIQSTQSDMYYSVFTLIYKAEHFLDDNKFVLKSSSSSGSECIVHTDIWELK